MNYGVPALVGATSAVHLALVTALGAILPLPLASLALNLAAAAAALAALFRLLDQAEASRSEKACALLVAAIMPGYHFVNGLETGLAFAAVAWTIVLAEAGSRVALPLLCGTLPFIRPDLAPLSACLIAWRAWEAWRTSEKPLVALRSLATDLAFASLAAAPWLAWYWIETGAPIPQTIGAKRAFFAEAGLPILSKAAVVIRSLIASGVLFLFTAAFFAWRARFTIALAAFVAIFLAAYVQNLPGGLQHNHYRYLVPLIPVGIYFLSRVEGHRLRSGILATLAVAMVLQIPAKAVDVHRGLAIAEDNVATAQWVAANLPPGSVVLVHDAGAIAYFSKLQLVDVVGLKRPSAISFHERLTAPSSGMRRGDAISEIAKSSRATHAIILRDVFWGQIADQLRDHGFLLSDLRTPRSRGYAVFKLTP